VRSSLRSPTGDENLIIAVSGTSGVGKTTLVEDMIEELSKRGVSVASVKHVHGPDVLVPEGKDTSRHLKAGSSPVIGLSSNEMVIYLSGERDLDYAIDVLKKMSSPDVVIVEGFKHSKLPKIVIGDADVEGKVLLRCPTSSDCARKAVDLIGREVKIERIHRSLPRVDCGKCGFSNCRDLAESITSGTAKESDCVNRSDSRSMLIVDGRQIPLGKFVSDLVAGTVTGLVKTLKEVGEPHEIEIRIRSGPESGEDDHVA
jgi:molybdopterin-guanine dinucleotide biosynthesis protein MobB